ncbi:efflux RND transporter periplasmic adaptor subunit [Pantoea sp. 18069]|uniref:efflux RND transporter periplasmic adaptor subunit n=1 Tax=Pantoea sp. 18069 TaxID=2681415 RepID=UPI00135B7C81|nr:efflux RND transporter periplasmic adaptor subunit [Pantoea sp. 18069]
MPSLPSRPSLLSIAPLPLAGMVALVLCACSPQAPPSPQAAPEVGVHTVATQRLPVSLTLSGRTMAHMTSDVRPQVGGILQKRLFTEGQTVKAGQVLYEINPAAYQAAFGVARGNLAQAEAAVLSARPKAQRYETLVALEAVSRQDGEDAIAMLRQSEAAVVAASAALEVARINLDHTRITAPIGGRIGMSSYTPGALVSAGQAEVLATIQQLDPIYVDVTQSSSQLLQLRRRLDAGQLRAVDGKAQVSVELEDGSTYAHTGTLEVVDARVDESTGSVRLRAVVPNPDHVLLPGMYVRAVLAMAFDEAAILAPQQAVTRNAKGQAQAMVVDAEGKVEQRQLRTGAAVGDRWIIAEGLAAGDRLIVEGAQRARAGMLVRPVEVTAPAVAPARAGVAAN